MGITSVLTLICFALVLAVESRCPPANQVRGPECRENYECHKGPCCPNWLGKKSCVNTVPYNNQKMAQGRYPRMILFKTGTGVYCEGVKCMPYQTCKPDRSGKLRCQ